MRTDRRRTQILSVLLLAGSWLFLPQSTRAQDAPATGAPTNAQPDMRRLADVVRQLQDQVRDLSTEVSQLKASNDEAHVEMRQLRNELYRSSQPHVQTVTAAPPASSSYTLSTPSPAAPAAIAGAAALPQDAQSLGARIAALEENQDLTNSRLQEQSQTKVESGSKYRVRLTGIVLMNTFETIGNVDNLDFPEIAVPKKRAARPLRLPDRCANRRSGASLWPRNRRRANQREYQF